MSRLSQFFQNPVLWATLAAWFVAQTLKVVLAVRREHQFDFRWFLGTGGMPSAHSSGVSALAVSVGLTTGFNTAVFAIALIFALVTMFDAQGVRRAAGRQAMLLNKILLDVYSKREISDNRLKELLGHTPIEVIVGAAIGSLMALMLC